MEVSTSTPAAAVSPLRQRMLEDMRMRQFAEHTQEGYIRAVRKLSTFLGRSPHTASAEDLRRFQLHLVDTGSGPVTINATITGLKIFSPFSEMISSPVCKPAIAAGPLVTTLSMIAGRACEMES